MISSASLSAFSAGAAQTLPSLRAASTTFAAAARDAAGSSPTQSSAPSAVPSVAPAAGQRLPRGSLLNLTV